MRQYNILNIYAQLIHRLSKFPMVAFILFRSRDDFIANESVPLRRVVEAVT